MHACLAAPVTSYETVQHSTAQHRAAPYRIFSSAFRRAISHFSAATTSLLFSTILLHQPNRVESMPTILEYYGSLKQINSNSSSARCVCLVSFGFVSNGVPFSRSSLPSTTWKLGSATTIIFYYVPPYTMVLLYTHLSVVVGVFNVHPSRHRFSCPC